MPMNLLRMHIGRLFGILAALVLASGGGAQGQISTLKNAVAGDEAAKPKTSDTPEETRARLEQWLAEAHDTLERLGSPNAASALPPGITAVELEDRAADAEQMVLTINRSLKSLASVFDAPKELERSRAEEKAWSGFTEKPPYSILMLDELLNERDAAKSKLSSREATLRNIEPLAATSIQETKAAETAVGERLLAVQHASGGELAAAKWRLEAARAKSRLAAVQARLLQTASDSLGGRIEAAKLDLSLLDRKVQVISSDVRFTDADLAKVRKITEERKAAINKELAAVSKRLKTAINARAKAKDSLDALASSTPPPSASSEPMSLAKLRLEVSEDCVESVQSIVEGLESLTQLDSINLKAYQDRKDFLDASDQTARDAALAAIKNHLEHLSAWASVLTNEKATTAADLANLDSRQASLTTEDPRFSLINEQRKLKSEKAAMIERLSQAVSLERKLLKRWIAEYSPKPGEEGLFVRIRTLAATSWETAKKVWSFEVMYFDNSVEVDGEVVPGKIPISLGMLLRAILFFSIGYWISSRLANHIQRKLVKSGHMMDAQARTLRNWGMIVVGLFLVFGTLAFLRIPLTVFAFFGGALAIGLGFGLQTLIKNFISGIIVLVERKVRVGDMLDVDGITGTVVEVNTRSSVIRGPDDVETMIPNSVFLENRVTNWTLTSSKMRRAVRVGVAYGSSPQVVMDVLTEAAGRHGLVRKNPAPFAIFEDFGDSALVFCLYFWVDMGGQGNALVIASDLRLMIEKRFQELGVSVPFPQRDVNLNSANPITVRIASGEKQDIHD